MCLLHSCDNPPCCNVEHLRPGTRKDNRQDAIARQRTPKGTAHHMAKFLDSDIVDIRRAYEAGAISQRALAERYGVAQTTIGKIVRRLHWAHV